MTPEHEPAPYWTGERWECLACGAALTRQDAMTAGLVEYLRDEP